MPTGIRNAFAAALLALAAPSFAQDCFKNHFILAAPCDSQQAGDLNVPRSRHTATLLANGKVLVAGGYEEAGRSAEIYDPATRTWTLTAPMNTMRDEHTATLLSDGRVLVVGGDRAYDDGTSDSRSTAEIYDPESGSWTMTGSLGSHRGGFSASLLATGRVLVAGGIGDDGFAVATAELYDPATRQWSPTGSLHQARFAHTAVVLQDARVLVVGGEGSEYFATQRSSAEIYDPRTGTWSHAEGMHEARSMHQMTLLEDGRVLVTGGYNETFGPPVRISELGSTEIFDPETGAWTVAANLVAPRYDHQATLLEDGRIFIAGGARWLTRRDEVLSADASASTPLDIATPQRWGRTATRLPDGSVLLAGGSQYLDAKGYPAVILRTSELFFPRAR